MVTPFTFLGIIAQNTIPGEFLYSIKRSYEGGALLALSVFPSAKADYTTNLASTRFNEAEKLITKKSDTQGLTALVTQVRQAKQEIATVSNQKQKEELQQKLVTSITQYQQGLNVVAAQVATQNSIAFVPTAINDTQPTQNVAYIPPGQQQTQQNQLTQQQTPSQNNSGGQQSPTQAQPTPTNTLASGAGAGATPTDIIKSIQDTQNTLGSLKQQVQQIQIIQITPTITTIPSPTHAPSPTMIPSPTFYPSPTYSKKPTNKPFHKKEEGSDPGSASADD